MAFERRGGAFLLRDTRVGNNALNAFNVIFPLFPALKLHLPPTQDDDDQGVEYDADDIDYDAEGGDNDKNVACLKSVWFK